MLVFFWDFKVVLFVLIILYFVYKWFFCKLMYLFFWLGMEIFIGVFFVLYVEIGLCFVKYIFFIVIWLGGMVNRDNLVGSLILVIFLLRKDIIFIFF